MEEKNQYLVIELLGSLLNKTGRNVIKLHHWIGSLLMKNVESHQGCLQHILL